MLRALKTGSLGIAKDRPLPSRLVVMPWGESEINGGERLYVNEVTLSQLPENQRRTNFDRVALDFNHNSVEGSKYYKGEPVEVAGYATLSVVPGEGLVYEDIEYTLSGEERLRNGDYIDLSPCVKHNDKGEVIFLHSTAVCRQGQIRGLTILCADPLELQQTQDNDMDYKKILTALLGLSAEATDADIETAAGGLDLKTMASTLSEQAETIKTFSAQADELKTLKADLAALKPAEGNIVVFDADQTAELKALRADLDALKQADETRERTAILSAALGEGKIVPKSAEALPVEQLRTLCAELPADQVPVGRRTPEHIKVLAAERPDGSEQIRQSLGISEDDWKKYNN